MAALAPSIHCLAPDLPGHGRNPQSDCSFAAMSAQILADLAEIGIDSFYLLGYSLGARLALYLLTRTRAAVLSAVLESGSPGLESEAARQARRLSDEALANRLERQPLETFLQGWYQQPLFDGLRAHPAFASLLELRRHNRPEALARSLRQAGTGVMPPLWQDLSGIRIPILYLAGREDPKFCRIGAEMAAFCPTLQLELLPCGHSPHLEVPPEWLACVTRFLNVRA